ncbi:MAG: hypothetical protein WKF30_02915 [Pyrinomonadaceae bacterium]
MEINTMNKFFTLFAFLFLFITSAQAQTAPTMSASSTGTGLSLAPARVELEMKPGAETTVVVNLDYHSPGGTEQPTRIVATLNDWDITKDGRVEFYKALTRPNSASSWLVYSPAETTVTPGNIHSIRVTVSVPQDATPGDHLTSLIIEQRPDTIKFNQSARQVIVRYRMATVFYIKVSGLTRRGTLANLQAESSPKGIVITPTLKNEGNSVIRPAASVKIADSTGKIVAEVPGIEPLPVLANSETSQPLLIKNVLPPGSYSVKYKIDFQDGSKATEGIVDLIVKDFSQEKRPQISSTAITIQKP